MSDTPSAKDIFADAIEMNPRDRDDFVRRSCSDDAVLIAEVLGLIAFHDGAKNFLKTPTVAPGRASTGATGEGPGSVIGRYRLIQQLGEGGFGTVFLAEQREPVIRQVALKIIKPGMDSVQVIARFEAERQALALMDHANIAKVLDAGATERGRPYFVMELVNGDPITAYCDKSNLDIHARLSVFTQVCRAVQHAHTKGVIHRDIKPNNVLVSTQDGRPVARVIDFGIAKATDHRQAEKAAFTELRQMIGTPEYMSPEQAGGGPDIDTRTDVYSLGVLLYELLTGSTPFDPKSLRSAAYGELQRIIREVDPPRPSTRLSEITDTIQSIAATRGVEPRRLGATVRGELDWIVMKAMEKERGRRYESPGGLADDIGRYLSGDAVLAAPPGAGYRIGKFIRRHRVGVAVACVIGLALAGGLSAALFGLSIARTERDAARNAERAQERERIAAERVTGFMQEMFAAVDPDIAQSRDVSLLKEILDSAAERIERGELKDSPAAEAELRIRIAAVYVTIVDPDKAARVLAPAAEILAKTRSDDLSARERLIEGQAGLAKARSKFDESLKLYQELVDVRRQRYGDRHDQVARAIAGIASSQFGRGRYKEAAKAEVEALEVAEAVGGDLTRAVIHSQRAATLQALGQLKDSLEHGTKSIELYRKAKPGDNPNVALMMTSMVTIRALQGAPLPEVEAMQRESIGMFKRMFPGGHPNLGLALNNLAWLLREQGKLDEAEPVFADALASHRRFNTDGGAGAAQVLINLGQLARTRGDLSLAESRARDAFDQISRSFPDGHQVSAIALSDLGIVLREQLKFEPAAAAYHDANELQRRLLGPTHPNLGISLTGEGECLVRLGRASEAVPLFREALQLAMGQKPADPAKIAALQLQVATALSDTGSLEDAKEAESLAREAHEYRRKALKPEDWRLAFSQTILGYAVAATSRLNTGAPRADRLARAEEARSMVLPAAERLLVDGAVTQKSARTIVTSAAVIRAVAVCQAVQELDPSEENARLLNTWKQREHDIADKPR